MEWQSLRGDQMYLTLNCLQVLYHLSPPAICLLPGMQNSALLLSSIPYSDNFSESLSPASESVCTDMMDSAHPSSAWDWELRAPFEQGSYFNSQFLCDCFLIHQLKKAFKQVLSHKCCRSLWKCPKYSAKCVQTVERICTYLLELGDPDTSSNA